MNKNILVTGANGQLGREIQRASQISKDNFVFTDVEQLDITDSDAVLKCVSDSKIDVIINCAAYTNVDRAEEDELTCDLINNVAVRNLAWAAKESGATLIHVSTDYVFDGTNNLPYSENCPTSPTGVYGKTKLKGEQSVIESGCNYIILRTSWLYSQWGANFVKTMLKLTKERDELGVIFDQVGTPTFAGDLADAILAVISSDKLSATGVYHFSNEGVCSWYDFANMIAQIAGNECYIKPLHTCEYPSKVARPHFSVLDKTKFKSTFNFAIPYWTASLQTCINQLKNE